MAKFMVQNQATIHRWIVRLIVFFITKKLNIDNYIISGSYRRGKWFCNDIDLIIPVKSKFQKNKILDKICEIGWISMDYEEHQHPNMWAKQFMKKIGRNYMVLDVFLVDSGLMGNALVFTTGPKEFNDKIRAGVSESGYSWENPKYFLNLKNNNTISFDIEKDVFNFLKLEWIEPKDRV
jgi:DNA polymerase/3'-5' exonuclease PolX